MSTVYCVFRKIKTEEGEEVGLLVSIHGYEPNAIEETKKLNAPRKTYHYYTFWNVQP